MGLNIEEQKAVERFQKEVVEPSMTKLVVLDFWAEWCGPCKALAPMLEKVAAQYADKGVVLKKINVDEEQFIASQFQVQSIPTVYAMFQGRPVADLTSARSESQLTQALDQILAQLPIDPNAAGADSDANNGMPEVEQLIAMGEQLLDAGETEKAVQLYTEIATAAPPEIATRPEIQSGLIRALLANGQHEQAQAAFDAGEFEGAVAFGVKKFRRRFGRADQIDAMLVEHIDQSDKALGLVAALRPHARDAA